MLRRTPVLFLLVVLAAVGLRALAWSGYDRGFPYLDLPILDAAMYHADAARVAAGEPLAGGPYYHAPGYPFVLGVVYRGFGASPWAGLAVNGVLGALAAGLVFLLGARWFSRGAGLLAAALFVGYGPLLFFESKLLITPLAVLLSLALAGAARETACSGSTRGRVLWALGSGLLLGALAVCRANMLLAGVVLVVVWAVGTARGRTPAAVPAAFLAGALVFLGPVLVHNARAGAFVPVATQGGFNFYAGNHPGATGVYEGIPGVSGGIASQEANADSVVAAAVGHVLDPAAESRYWTRRAWREIGEDPVSWAALLLRKAVLAASRVEETVNGNWLLERDRVPLLRLLALPWNLLLGLGLLGGGLAVRRRERGLAGAGAVLLAVAVTCIGFFVMSRMRLPAAGVLAVFGGYALSAGWASWRGGSRGRVLATLAGLLVWTALTWSSPLGASRNPAWESQLFTTLGAEAERRGAPYRALAAYAEAAQADPVALEPRVRSGRLLMLAGKPAEALEAYEAAHRIAPHDTRVANNLGIIYMNLERWADADRVLSPLLETHPALPAPYYVRGRLAHEHGHPEAADWYAQAIERDPRFTQAYVGLILLLSRNHQREAAESWARQAARNGVALPPALLQELGL